MIYIKLRGGLGNQMFQYAICKSLAIKNNTKVKFDIEELERDRLRNFELGYFKVSGIIASNIEIFFFSLLCNDFISKILRLIGIRYFYIKQKEIDINDSKQLDINFDASVLDKKGNLYIDGYWQCEKYFIDIDEVIKNDFTLKKELDETNRNLITQIRNCNSTAIHVRRGDYVNNKHTNEFHGTCSLKYYLNAIKIIEKRVKNPEFFVFSDDLQWTKKNLKIKHPITFVSINHPKKAYKDLWLMANCKFFIIANSSFSWWGAWLSTNSNKIICAPKKWFNSTGEGHIVPKSWIRVEG